MNSLYALILTDSLHLPTIIGYFNTRPAACQARQSAHAWMKGESQSVESLKCFSNAAMKLQYHKIRGVDKSVCTAEQKIAYNMASRIYGDIRFAKVWQQYDSGKVPAFLQNDWESKAIRTYFTTWQRDYNKASAHYNEDAIFSALRAGLHDFICHHAPIFTTYKEVGQAFPAYYL